MEPTSFQFVLTMPGDSRLVGVIRAVVMQAASYAKLSTADGESLVRKVEDATATVLADGSVRDVPIAFEFQGTSQAVRVAITWSKNGSERRRELLQQISA
jgi:hypothetical protein